MPRHKGTATKNTTTLAGKSAFNLPNTEPLCSMRSPAAVSSE
jgi:hypothetical protein